MKYLQLIAALLVLSGFNGFAQNSKTKFCNQLYQVIDHSVSKFENIRGEILVSGERKVKRYATDFWFAQGGFPYIEYRENQWYYISQYFSSAEIDKAYLQLERLKKSISSCLADKWKVVVREKSGLVEKYIFEKSEVDPEISIYIVYDGEYATIYFQVKIT